MLAAAYAEAGRFDEAVATQRQALQWTPPAGRPDLTRRREERLRLYEKRQPFREEPERKRPGAMP